MGYIEYVDAATARSAGGLRLIVLGTLPSPWSEAAKGLFHIKQIPALGVRLRRGDDELRAWTGAHNVPVVLHDGEPPRSGWAEILALAERLGGSVSLVPSDPEARVRLRGLIGEIAAEDGLGWSSRLLMIHGSLSTGGGRSFPLPVGQYLAAKYGYAPERVAPARARIGEVLALCEQQLARSKAAGHAYMLGDSVSALDVFLATFLTPALFAEEDCPGMRPDFRPAFAHVTEEYGAQLPRALVEHRAFMFRAHLPWPIEL